MLINLVKISLMVMKDQTTDKAISVPLFRVITSFLLGYLAMPGEQCGVTILI